MRKSIQRALIVSIIIGLFYSYSGTGYLTWLYRVQNSFSTQIIDLLANFIDYFFQACGILIATLYLRIFPSNLRKVFIISTICEAFFIAAASERKRRGRFQRTVYCAYAEFHSHDGILLL